MVFPYLERLIVSLLGFQMFTELKFNHCYLGQALGFASAIAQLLA